LADESAEQADLISKAALGFPQASTYLSSITLMGTKAIVIGLPDCLRPGGAWAPDRLWFPRWRIAPGRLRGCLSPRCSAEQIYQPLLRGSTADGWVLSEQATDRHQGNQQLRSSDFQRASHGSVPGRGSGEPL